MIRVVCLAQATYVAVAVTTYVPRLAASCGPAMTGSVSRSAVGEMHVRSLCSYLLSVITKMPRILGDHSTSNIDTRCPPRPVERSKTLQDGRGVRGLGSSSVSEFGYSENVLAGEMGKAAQEMSPRSSRTTGAIVLAQLSWWPENSRSPPEAPLAPRL